MRALVGRRAAVFRPALRVQHMALARRFFKPAVVPCSEACENLTLQEADCLQAMSARKLEAVAAVLQAIDCGGNYNTVAAEPAEGDGAYLARE